MFEVDEKLIKEIREILKSLEENYEAKNEIDESLRIKFYSKVHQLPNSDEIILEFERIFALDLNLDKLDNSKETLTSLRPKRDAKFLPPPEIEKNKKCVEVFADFGAFFNKSISKFGFKYCSESEIVRRTEAIVVPSFEEKREQI
jgi:hypothetical protein